ncbi:hypothetical protein HAX54_053470 [Datura stramonium]|uniref:NADH:ubiquinone reductase (non-electrogenic) n=1 Tax=Datura stramonium TaxID=4076 RepID=A0ABS8WPI2_DATST|nr:hypothetical protein [Datura stramonium]
MLLLLIHHPANQPNQPPTHIPHFLTRQHQSTHQQLPIKPPNQPLANTPYNPLPPPIQNTPTVQIYPSQHIQGAHVATPHAQHVPPVYAMETQSFTNSNIGQFRSGRLHEEMERDAKEKADDILGKEIRYLKEPKVQPPRVKAMAATFIECQDSNLYYEKMITMMGQKFMDVAVMGNLGSKRSNREELEILQDISQRALGLLNDYPHLKLLVLFTVSGGGLGAVCHTAFADAGRVSRNYFAFTPLLPSVTCGTVEARSIVEPIRNIVKKKNFDADFKEAECYKIDTVNKKVHCKTIQPCHLGGGIEEFTVDYDYLVIAMGAQANTFNTPGVVENALLSKGSRRCSENSVRITLEAGDNILNMFDKRITAFAEEKFARDGIQLKTGSMVAKVIVKYQPKREALAKLLPPYGMCVWATGIGSRPVILDFMKQIGQVAAQQGSYLADCFNRMKVCEGNPEGPLRFRGTGRHRFHPFRYRHLGQFAPLGGEQTAAQLPGDWVSIGHSTQWLWYSVYASKLVSWRTRVLVVSDWIRRSTFGRDSSRICYHETNPTKHKSGFIAFYILY